MTEADITNILDTIPVLHARVFVSLVDAARHLNRIPRLSGVDCDGVAILARRALEDAGVPRETARLCVVTRLAA